MNVYYTRPNYAIVYEIEHVVERLHHSQRQMYSPEKGCTWHLPKTEAFPKASPLGRLGTPLIKRIHLPLIETLSFSDIRKRYIHIKQPVR